MARWWNPPPPEGAAEAWLEHEPTDIVFAIELDGRVVGSIQFAEDTDADYHRAGIDLFLTSDVQGQGIGPDAIRTVARYLIDVRGHHRLTIDPSAANERAIRAYSKLGFRPVGVAAPVRARPGRHLSRRTADGPAGRRTDLIRLGLRPRFVADPVVPVLVGIRPAVVPQSSLARHPLCWVHDDRHDLAGAVLADRGPRRRR